MSSFFSLVERPYEIIEKGIKQEFQPASKSEQLQFRKWLKTTKQEIDSRDSQFVRKMREAQIAYQRQKLIKEQLYRTKILRNRTLRNKLIKSGVIRKNRFPTGFGRSIKKINRFSFVGGTLFTKKQMQKNTNKIRK